MQQELLELHEELLITGRIPGKGLCHTIPWEYQRIFNEYMRPTEEDKEALDKEDLSLVYWASGLKNADSDDMEGYDLEMYSYTPLRQTILLLFAASYNNLLTGS